MLNEETPTTFASPVLTVSALLNATRLLLERNLPLAWIAGEISNFTRAASGHCYFVLKDRDAQVRCVFFRSRAAQVPFPLRDGMQVEIRAQPTLYEARGEFQLTVDALRLAGAGALYEQFVRLKATLEARGWFAAERKRALPSFPRAVGIVTSPRGAALHDVISTLERRSPQVRVIIYPCAVQGRPAAREIAAAIATANRRRDQDGIDLLIVCRGGGSIEDLWAFNEVAVAHAIVNSELPVISGVGHETDFTISDFVADARAPTPTAAAELAAPVRDELERSARARYAHLRAAFHRQVERAMQRMDYVGRRLQHPASRLRAQNAVLADIARRLRRCWTGSTAARERALETMQARLLQDARAPWPQRRRLDSARADLREGWSALHRGHERKLDRFAIALTHLNPDAVLERGYAIVTAGDVIIQDSAQVSVGESLHVRLARGAADVEVLRKD